MKIALAMIFCCATIKLCTDYKLVLHKFLLCYFRGKVLIEGKIANIAEAMRTSVVIVENKIVTY